MSNFRVKKWSISDISVSKSVGAVKGPPTVQKVGKGPLFCNPKKPRKSPKVAIFRVLPPRSASLAKGFWQEVQNVFSIGPREGILYHLFGNIPGFHHQKGLFPVFTTNGVLAKTGLF